MNQSIKRIVVTVLVISATISTALGQENDKTRLEFDGWTLQAQPFRGAEHNSTPVEVVSLAIKKAGNEFRITDLVLKNQSSRDVRRVEVNWRLVKEENNEKIILGTGFPISRLFPNNLSAGEGIALKFAVIKIPRIMFGKEELSGDYQIEVAVTNIFYADGTSWGPRRLARQI